ncbi:MAG: hypothetical protein GX442_00705 [Candidatus Riflebacteria bacterium]|nr:hypothetical protein [Candidatus Riflebacteria bacterium]
MRRMFQGLLVAGLLASLAIAAGWPGEIALVTDIQGEVVVDPGTGETWTPLVGETLPVNARIRVPTPGLLKLLHLGLNQELTLPAGAEATLAETAVTMVTGTIENGARIEGLVGSLSIEAASTQQLGAVNPQRMNWEKSARGGADEAFASLRKELEGLPATVHRGGQAPGGDAKSMDFEEPAPTPDKAKKPAGITAHGSPPPEEAAQELTAAAEVQAPPPTPVAEPMPAPCPVPPPPPAPAPAISRSPKGSITTVSLAVPRDHLPRRAKKGALLDLVPVSRPKRGRSWRFPVRVVDSLPSSTGEWMFLDVVISSWPTDETLLPGKIAGAPKCPVTLEWVDPAGPSPLLTAVGLEGKGCHAQAAAIWLTLGSQATAKIAPEILDKHLQRLKTKMATR